MVVDHDGVRLCLRSLKLILAVLDEGRGGGGRRLCPLVLVSTVGPITQLKSFKITQLKSFKFKSSNKNYSDYRNPQSPSKYILYGLNKVPFT